jgi:hypothetical protein
MGNMSDTTMSISKSNDTFQVPKLHDDGSDWVDYEAHIWKAMGAKGLLRIVEGTAIKLVMYYMVMAIMLEMMVKHW